MTVHFDTSPEARVKRELDEDEHLLWLECPEASEVAQRSWGTSVVGVFVTLFAFWWMSGAMWVTHPHRGFAPPSTVIHTNVPGEPPIIFPRMAIPSSMPPSAGPPSADIFALFGLIFVGIGLYLTFSPFFNAVKATNTIYALTERRALIIEDGTSERVQNFGPRDIERIERRERANGLGDLIFARRVVRRSGRHHHSYEREIGFLSVKRVKEAERFMRQHLLRGE